MRASSRTIIGRCPGLMARVARACGFGIGDLRFRECPRFVPHSTDPANPAKSHKPPNTHKPASPAEAPRVAKPAPRSGRRKASLRDQNPGSEKKRGSDPAKKPASNHPAFRMGLPRYRPQAAPRLAAAFRAFLTSARTCQSQSRRAAKPLFAAPAIPSAGSPNPAEGALRKPRWPALPYIWAGNPGNDFGGLSVAKSSKNQ